jgi:hypothetical protein
MDNAKMVAQAEAFDNEIDAITNALRGGRADTDIPPPSINARVGYVADRIRLSTVKPSQTQIAQYELSNAEFRPVLTRLRKMVETELPAFEKLLDAAGAPLVPGQLPEP